MAGRVELSVVAKNQASKVLKQVGGDIRDLSGEASKSKGALSDMFSVTGGNLLASGIRSAASAALDLGRAMVGAVADATTQAANMSAQVSGIGAVLGLTTEELGKVKNLINELGVNPNLKVNAQEAADAINMLATNGLTLEQILGGAAEATVFLANATGGAFDTAANVATDSMALFGIKAEDMMTAVDGITSVTVASKFSLDDYRHALSQAGGVASALGVEFDDYNTTIAATSALFAAGGDAGTSYKTFLQRLVPQSNEASNAMAELGLYSFNSQKAMDTLSSMGVKPLSGDMNSLINQLMKAYAATHKVNLGTKEGLLQFNDWAKEAGFVQNSFYDANGQLKSMADISSILSDATANLTEEQKNQYLSTIFGSDAMRTAFGLAEKGQVVYTDVAKAAKELGVSQEDLTKYAEGGITAFEAMQATMAKTDALKGAQMRVDNLSGDMEIFGGIVDSVKTQLGDRLQPALRTVFQEMTKSLSSVTPQILAFGDVIGRQVTAAITRMTNAFNVFKSGGGIKDIGKALGVSPKLINIITAVVKNIDLLKGAFKGLATALAIGGAIAGVAATIAGVAATIALLTNPITLVASAAAALGMAWETNFGGIQEKTMAVINFLRPGFEQLFSWISAAAGGDFSGLQEGLNGAIDTVTATIEAFHWADFVTALDSWSTYILDIFWPEFVTAVDLTTYVFDLAWSAFVTGTIAIIDYVKSIDWAAFVTGTIAIASYVTHIAWSAFVTGTVAIDSYVTSIDWKSFVTTTVDIASKVGPFAWRSFVTGVSLASRVTDLLWSSFVTGAIAISSYVTSIDWAKFVTDTISIATYAKDLAWNAFVTGTVDIANKVDKLLWPTFVTGTIAIAEYVTKIDWKAFVTGTVDIVSKVEKLLWTTFVTGTIAIASYVTALDWKSFITGTVDIASKAGNLLWASFVTGTIAIASYATSLDWKAFVTGTVDITTKVGSLLWGRFVTGAVTITEYVTKIDWKAFVTGTVDIAAKVGDFAWSAFVTGIDFTTKVDPFPGWGSIFSGDGSVFSGTDFSSLKNDVSTALANVDWAGSATAFVQNANTARDNFLQSMTDAVAGIDWSTMVINVAGFVDKLASSIASVDWTSMSISFGGFVDNIAGKINSIDWSQITVGEIGAAISAVVAPALTAGVAGIVWVMSSDKFGGLVTAVKDSVSGIDWAPLKNSFGKLGSAIVDAVSSMDWGGIKSAFGNLGTAVIDAITGLDWSGVTEPFRALGAKIQSAIDSMISTLSFGLLGSGGGSGYAGPYAPAASGGGGGGFGGSSAATTAALNTPNRTNPFARPQNAAGTDNWRGGLTWVDERGAELFHFPDGRWAMGSDKGAHLMDLPKGTEIYSHEDAKKMLAGGLTTVGANADGTTAAPANNAPKANQNVFGAIANAAQQFGQSSKELGKTMKETVKDLEGTLRKVPGLFGTSQVTADQMKMGELGVPQNFADDWVRRLTDEVVNGVDWEGVDIKDAAARAGIDPALPAEAILEMVKQKWNDKSLFADSKNLDLINMDAVKQAMQQEAQAKMGEANFLSFLGITPQQAGTAGVSTGASAGAGMITGITQSLTDGGAGTQVATSLSTGITPESMAPIGTAVVGGLTTELKKDEYGDQIGTALSALFTSYLDKADAFADVAQKIMGRITAQFGNITGLDMVSKFTDAFRAQLGSDEAIASLARVGEKILELVFRGYLDESRKRNWAEGVNAKGDTSNQSSTTTATTGTAAKPTNTKSRSAIDTGTEPVVYSGRSRLFAPSESMALAGAGGDVINITINPVINTPVDMHQMIYKILDEIRRRR